MLEAPIATPNRGTFVPRAKEADIWIMGNGRKPSPIGESRSVDVGAAVVGLAAGIVVGPLADRLATNAPLHDPLLRSVPRSSRIWLVSTLEFSVGWAWSDWSWSCTLDSFTYFLFAGGRLAVVPNPLRRL